MLALGERFLIMGEGGGGGGIVVNEWMDGWMGWKIGVGGSTY